MYTHRRYGDAFARHRVDGVALVELTQEDLLTHLGVAVLGHAKRILHQVPTYGVHVHGGDW